MNDFFTLWFILLCVRENAQLLIIQFVGMLSPEIVVIGFEGFRHKTSGFNIKELSICSSNYSDTVLFLPPISFNSLSSSERKSHQWVKKHLHGVS